MANDPKSGKSSAINPWPFQVRSDVRLTEDVNYFLHTTKISCIYEVCAFFVLFSYHSRLVHCLLRSWRALVEIKWMAQLAFRVESESTRALCLSYVLRASTKRSRRSPLCFIEPMYKFIRFRFFCVSNRIRLFLRPRAIRESRWFDELFHISAYVLFVTNTDKSFSDIFRWRKKSNRKILFQYRYFIWWIFICTSNDFLYKRKISTVPPISIDEKFHIFYNWKMEYFSLF